MKLRKRTALIALLMMFALALSSAVAFGSMAQTASAEDVSATSATAETYKLGDFPYNTGYSNFDWYTSKANADYKMMIGPFDANADNYGLTAFDIWDGSTENGGTGDNGNLLRSSTYTKLKIQNWKWWFQADATLVIAIRSKIKGIIEFKPSTSTVSKVTVENTTFIHSIRKYNAATQTFDVYVDIKNGTDSVSGTALPSSGNVDVTVVKTDRSFQVEVGDVIYYEYGATVDDWQRNIENMTNTEIVATPLNTENAPEYYGSLLDDYVASLTKTNYTDETWATIEGHVTTFKSGNYESATDAKAAYDKAVADINAVPPDSKTYFEGQLDALVATLTQTDYEDATWEAIQGYVTKFKEETYADAAAIKAAYEKAVASINNTKPDSLSYLRTTLLNSVETYYKAQTESYFTAEDWTALKKAYEDYVAGHESYTTKETLQAYFDAQYAAMTAPKPYIQTITYMNLHTAVYENDYGWVEGPVADITMLTGSVHHGTLCAFDTYESTSAANTLTNSELYAEYNGAYAQNWKWYVGMNIGVTIAYRANQDCSLVIGATEGQELNDAGWTEMCTINEYIVREGETKLIRTTALNDQPTDEVFFGTWYLKEGDILYIEFISNSDHRNTESPYVLEATLDATKFNEDAYAEQNHDLPPEVIEHIEEKLAELKAYFATLNEADYSATNWVLLEDYVAQFESKCEMEVSTIEDVDALYNTTRSGMEGVLTLQEEAQQLKATLDGYVKELRDEYNALIEKYKYSDENKAALDKALEDGIAAIEAATTVAAGNSARSRALTTMRNIEGKEKGGCGSVITAPAAVLGGAVILAGAVLVLKKKRSTK